MVFILGRAIAQTVKLGLKNLLETPSILLVINHCLIVVLKHVITSKKKLRTTFNFAWFEATFGLQNNLRCFAGTKLNWGKKPSSLSTSEGWLLFSDHLNTNVFECQVLLYTAFRDTFTWTICLKRVLKFKLKSQKTPAEQIRAPDLYILFSNSNLSFWWQS